MEGSSKPVFFHFSRPRISLHLTSFFIIAYFVGQAQCLQPGCNINNSSIFINFTLGIPIPKWSTHAENILRINYSFFWSRELLQLSKKQYHIAAHSTDLDVLKTLDSSIILTERFLNESDNRRNQSKSLISRQIIQGCEYELFEDYVTIETDFLGRVNFSVILYDSQVVPSMQVMDSNDTSILRTSSIIIVLKKIRTVEIVFRVFIYIFIVIITFSMGTALDPKVIWAYMRRPIAPAIGFGCQYFLMPMIAFGMAMVFPMNRALGFGLVTVGCSPGGGASNIWTMLLGGDLNLSMVMTFFSSTAALGMMPLWLFLLKNFFLGANVRVPFEHITGDLLLIVIPVCSGMLLRWKKEQYALKVCRITTPLSHVFVIYILTFSTYVNWYIFRMFYRQPHLMAIGASLPWAGFLAGALAAFLLRQSRAQIIAIALETGIQNVGIAIVVLMYSFEQPEGSIGAAMPIATSLFTPVPLYIVLAVIKIRRRCSNRNNDQKLPIAVEDTPPEMSEGNDEKESDEDVEKQSLSSSYRSSSKEESIPMEEKETAVIAFVKS